MERPAPARREPDNRRGGDLGRVVGPQRLEPLFVGERTNDSEPNLRRDVHRAACEQLGRAIAEGRECRRTYDGVRIFGKRAQLRIGGGHDRCSPDLGRRIARSARGPARFEDRQCRDRARADDAIAIANELAQRNERRRADSLRALAGRSGPGLPGRCLCACGANRRVRIAQSAQHDDLRAPVRWHRDTHRGPRAGIPALEPAREARLELGIGNQRVRVQRGHRRIRVECAANHRRGAVAVSECDQRCGLGIREPGIVLEITGEHADDHGDRCLVLELCDGNDRREPHLGVDRRRDQRANRRRQ